MFGETAGELNYTSNKRLIRRDVGGGGGSSSSSSSSSRSSSSIVVIIIIIKNDSNFSVKLYIFTCYCHYGLTLFTSQDFCSEKRRF